MHFREAYDPFRALGGAWNLVPRAPATLILGALLLCLVDQWGLGFHFEEGHLAFGWLVGPWMALCCLAAVALWAFSCLLTLGMAEAVRRAARGEPERIGVLLEPRGRFFDLLLASLLRGLASLAASGPFGVIVFGPIVLGAALDLRELGILLGVLGGLAYLPLWLWLLLGLAFVPEAVAFEGRAPLEAMRRSFELARGRRLRIFYYGLVLRVLAAGGLCLCFVGVFLTAPWARLAWFESFQRLGEEAPGS